MTCIQHNLADLFGEFFGHDLDMIQCDVLMWRHIDSKHRENEHELFKTKWFDYRIMHPTKATYLFAECYRNAYRMISQVRFDVGRGAYMKGLKGKTDEIFNLKPTELMGLWKARRAADEHGIPYDFYCNTAMRYADMTQWVRMPRPTQLRGKDKMLPYIIEKWEEEKGITTPLAQSDMFTSINYFGHVDQQAYEEYLLDECEKRGIRKHYLVGQLVFIDRVLREEVAEEHFGHEVLNEAREHSSLLNNQSSLT